MTQRLTIWVGDDPERCSVHTEDDMVMIESYDEDNDQVEVLICAALFPKIRECIDELDRPFK
jgi:hypothetical protein